MDLPGRGILGPMRAQRSRKSDRSLIKACKEGDESAWEALVEKYKRLVYSIPYRIGLDEEEAAEVFQFVFLSLISHIDDLRQEETLVPWLVTTTQRRSWKLARASARRAVNFEELQDGPAGHASVEDDLEAIERQLAVRSALDRLDDRCRRLLEILFYSEPPAAYDDVSRRMSMPVASIGPTRMRCLEKLRRELRRSGLF